MYYEAVSRFVTRAAAHPMDGRGCFLLEALSGTHTLEVGGSANGVSRCVACRRQLRGNLSLAAYLLRPSCLPRLAAGA